MTAATDEETLDWFRALESVRVQDWNLYYNNPESACVQLHIPESFDGILHLSRAIALLSSVVEEQFNGAVVWLTDCDALNPITDRVGWRMVEAMRRNMGENRPIGEAPGHFFRSDELVDFCAVLSCCMAFKWDAYTTTIGPEHFFISVRNSGYIVIASGDRESFEVLTKRLGRFGLTPVAPPQERTKYYCRKT